MKLKPFSEIFEQYSARCAEVLEFESAHRAACTHSRQCCGCSWITCQSNATLDYGREINSDYSAILAEMEKAAKFKELASLSFGEFRNYLDAKVVEHQTMAFAYANNPGPVNAGVKFFS